VATRRETLAVCLTPSARGAVATVTVEGPDATTAVARFFQPHGRYALDEAPLGRILVGRWGSSRGEEVVVARLAADRVEVHCHGGRAAVAAVLDALASAECRVVDWRDWIRREADPIRSDAAIALAGATTERTAGVLLDQYNGALHAAIARLKAQLDEGDTSTAMHEIESLLGRAPFGQRLVTGFRVVLAGAPNVGKSSLINRLVGFDRAIVSDRPGTTRDAVTARTALDGWPVELVDTAGLRSGADAIEAAGVALARSQVAAADVVVLVFDASEPWSHDDRRIVEEHPAALIVHNKCDLRSPTTDRRPPGLAASALTGEGVRELVQQVARALVPDPPEQGAAVPFTEQQTADMEDARRCLASGDQATATRIIARWLASDARS